MLAIVLSLIYAVSAQTSTVLPLYSRIYLYLQELKRLENERIQSKYINKGITYIEHSVFTAANQGLVKFTTEPFPGCEFYSLPIGVDKAICENIVNGIHTLVLERFPDKEVLYDATTKQYTLKWD